LSGVLVNGYGDGLSAIPLSGNHYE